MDPVTIGAVLLAVISGAGEGLGAQLWKGLVSLVRRPFQGKVGTTTVLPTGEAELAALQQAPADERLAVALAKVLLARADAENGFRQALQSWWEQAEPVRACSGNVSNTISGGRQEGPVLMGRDFGNISFGAPPVAPQPGPPS